MIVEVGCLKYISNNDDRNGCPSDISLPTSQNIPHKAVQTRIDYLLELWCNNTCDKAFTNSTQPWFECYQTEMVWIRNACTQSNSTPCNLTPSFLSRICTHAHPHTPQTHTHTHKHSNLQLYAHIQTRRRLNHFLFLRRNDCPSPEKASNCLSALSCNETEGCMAVERDHRM